MADVPSNWAWVRLNEIGEFCGGSTPSKNRSEYWGGDVPWVSPKDMKFDHVTSSELSITQSALKNTRIRLLPAGSVLVVARSGILKRTLPVAINDVACTVNQDLKVIVPFDSRIASYVSLMLRGFEEFILTSLVKGGMTVQSLKYDEFSKQPFPLPPLAEQGRIMRTVNQLTAMCDRLEESLSDERQSRVATAHSCLASMASTRDKAELRSSWQRIRDHFDVLFDIPDTVDPLEATIAELAIAGTLLGRAEPYPLVSIDTLLGKARLKNGLSPKEAQHGAYRCLTLSAMRDGIVDLQATKRVDIPDARAEHFLVSIGDVFLVRGNGSKHLVGRAGRVVAAVERVIFPDLFIRISLDSQVVLPDYFVLAWNAPSTRAQLERLARTTSGIWKINQGHVTKTRIAVPSIEEQARIVKRVANLTALCCRLRSSNQRRISAAERLLSSMVRSSPPIPR